MAFKDLIHWNWGRKNVPVRREAASRASSLHREMSHVLDRFFDGSDFGPLEGPAWLGGFEPCIDVSETDDEVQISAELPGMDEKDIDVSLSDDVLVLKGERVDEHEEKRKDYYHREQMRGSFHRAIQLPAEIDTEKVRASFKKGVLTITLPKAPGAHTRRIEIKAAS